MTDGCKSYKEWTDCGWEYDCDYEYSGGINCEDCIFGCCGGIQDPRINPYGECEVCGVELLKVELEFHDGQLMCGDCWDKY